MCVCLPPGLLKSIKHILQFLCTAFAIDTIDGWGFNNEARRVLLSKKSKVMLYLLFITQ